MREAKKRSSPDRAREASTQRHVIGDASFRSGTGLGGQRSRAHARACVARIASA